MKNWNMKVKCDVSYKKQTKHDATTRYNKYAH